MLPEKDNQVTEFVDQEGKKHIGQVFVLTDSEGQDYSRFREAGTGKLFPLNNIPRDKQQKAE